MLQPQGDINNRMQLDRKVRTSAPGEQVIELVTVRVSELLLFHHCRLVSSAEQLIRSSGLLGLRTAAARARTVTRSRLAYILICTRTCSLGC